MIHGFDMEYCVYKHTTPSGKVYIGITSKNPVERWANGNGYRNNKHFYSAIKHYGWNNIRHEILFSGLKKEEAEEIEIDLIKIYDSTNHNLGYNVAAGGRASYGYKHSSEEKEKISKSLTGIKHSDSRKKNSSLAHRKTWLNEDYRRRMREAHLGKCKGSKSPFSKKVEQLDLDGNIVAVYDSMSEAERMTAISHQKISSCCSGKTKLAGGFSWRLINQ